MRLGVKKLTAFSRSILNKDVRPSFSLSQMRAVIFAVGGRWLQDECRSLLNRFQLRLADSQNDLFWRMSAARWRGAKASLAMLGMAAMIAGAFVLPAPALAQTTLTVTADKTVTVDVAAGSTISYQDIKGHGNLLKKGEGMLDATSFNNWLRGTIRLEAGQLRISKDRQIAHPTAMLHFVGGTLSLMPRSRIKISMRRPITVEKSGTFYVPGYSSYVHSVLSTVSGSGEIKKTGVGDLSFRGIHANNFMGTIRVEAGRLVIDEGRDLGSSTNGLVLSGGTIWFALPPSPKKSILLEASRWIEIESAGTFETVRNTVVVKSTLSGAGELTKIGHGILDFSNIADASGFTGGMRIEQGKLVIDEDKDLGASTSGLIFSGGTVRFANATTSIVLDKSRLIEIESAGTFETVRNTVVVKSILSGSGELKKLGAGVLDFQGIQAQGFSGDIRLAEGILVVGKDEELGVGGDLIFSGGSLRFASTVGMGYNQHITISARQITVESKGIIEATDNVFMQGTLSGTGMLSKKGYGRMDLSSIDASDFSGALRIEKGSVRATNEINLGSESSRIVLAGGYLNFGAEYGYRNTTATVTLNRSIDVIGEYYSWLQSTYSFLDIQGRISTAATATLRLAAHRAKFGNDNNIISHMQISGYKIEGSSASFGGSGTYQARKNVVFGSGGRSDAPRLVFAQDNDGTVDYWAFQQNGVSPSVGKKGHGRVTISNSYFNGDFDFFVDEGTLVDSGINKHSSDRHRIFVAATATMVLDATNEGKDKSFLYDQISGAGRLVKTGDGLLTMSGAVNYIASFEMREGVVLAGNANDLGRGNLIFSGGTLRLTSVVDYSPSTVSVRQIMVYTEGAIDTKDNFLIQGTLLGSGMLSKKGSRELDLSGIDASDFSGTLRIEKGSVKATNEINLGSERSRIVLAGGDLSFGNEINATVTLKTAIDVTGGNSLFSSYYSFLDIQGRISTAATATLRIFASRAKISNDNNKIGDIHIYRNVLEGSAASFGGSGKANARKQVIFGTGSGTGVRLAFDQDQDGSIEYWEFRQNAAYTTVGKKGRGRVTISNSYFNGSFDFFVEEGALVDGGTNQHHFYGQRNIFVSTAATMVFDARNEGGDKAFLYDEISGSGSMIKTGDGLLGMTGITNRIASFEMQEGVVSARNASDLGRGGLIFSGGTLRLDSASTVALSSITLSNSRITVKSSGTFDTRALVELTSTLQGSGELKKAGLGKLDLRSVQADMFSGTWRIEGGELQIDRQDDLGKADGLVFAGGTLSIEGSSTPISLSNTIAVSAATGHKALFALNNTVAMEKDFIDGFDAKSTIKVDFQQGAAARLTIGFGQDATVTLNNWIFSGGGNNVIDIGITDNNTTITTSQIEPLIANEVDFQGKGVLNIGRRVVLHNQESRLSMMGWTVSIAARQRFIVSVGIVSEGTLTLNHIGPKKLIGGGFMGKYEAGYWDMSETNGEEFRGKLNIFDGIVRVGNLGEKSIINVTEKGALEGGGEVGSVHVDVGRFGGGIWHQGTSSVTLTVRGNYTQDGGTYRVYLGPKFAAVTVKGTASLNKGTLTVTAIDAVAMTNTYTLMYASSLTVAAPNVKVTTTKVTINNVATEKDVTVTMHPFALARDSNVFANIVLTNSSTYMRVDYQLQENPMYHMYVKGRNGKQMAMWLQQIDLRNPDDQPANYGLLHITSAKQARLALSSLSGEMHVSASSAMMSTGTLLEDAATSQMRMAFGRQAKANQHALRTTVPGAGFGLADQANVGGGLGMWVQSLEIDKRYGGSGGISALSYSSSGSLLGFDLPVGDWRGGLFSGTSKSHFAQDAGQSTGTDDSYHAGMYAGRMWGSTALRAGLSYSSHEIRMSRRLHLPGADNQLSTSNYRAHTYALFGQLDRRFALSGVVLEPFVGLSQVRHTTGRFVEKGVFGLAISSEEQHAVANMVSAGLGVSGGFRLGSARVQARGMVSWKHDLDGGDAVASQSLGISDRLDVYGAGRESSSMELDAGVDVRLNPDARLGITYSELDVLDAGGRDGQFKAVLEFSM